MTSLGKQSNKQLKKQQNISCQPPLTSRPSEPSQSPRGVEGMEVWGEGATHYEGHRARESSKTKNKTKRKKRTFSNKTQTQCKRYE